MAAWLHIWSAGCHLVCGNAGHELGVHLDRVGYGRGRVGYLVRCSAGHQRGVHLEPVAEHVQHQQAQEAGVPLRVQHAQRGQQARRRQPAPTTMVGLGLGQHQEARVPLRGSTPSLASRPAVAMPGPHHDRVRARAGANADAARPAWPAGPPSPARARIMVGLGPGQGCRGWPCTAAIDAAPYIHMSSTRRETS